MKTYKVHDRAVVVILTLDEAHFLDRGIAGNYMQRTKIRTRIIQKLQDAMIGVERAERPDSEREGQ